MDSLCSSFDFTVLLGMDYFISCYTYVNAFDMGIYLSETDSEFDSYMQGPSVGATTGVIAGNGSNITTVTSCTTGSSYHLFYFYY